MNAWPPASADVEIDHQEVRLRSGLRVLCTPLHEADCRGAVGTARARLVWCEVHLVMAGNSHKERLWV